jgi:hypothetical protein
MKKVNEPAQIVLSIPHDLDDLDDASSATIGYKKPDGTEGVFSGDAVLDTTNETVTKDIDANIIDQIGNWRFVAIVEFAGGEVYTGEAHTEYVYGTYA